MLPKSRIFDTRLNFLDYDLYIYLYLIMDFLLSQDLEVLGEVSPSGNASGDEQDWEGEIEHLLTLEEDSTPNQ